MPCLAADGDVWSLRKTFTAKLELLLSNFEPQKSSDHVPAQQHERHTGLWRANASAGLDTDLVWPQAGRNDSTHHFYIAHTIRQIENVCRRSSHPMNAGSAAPDLNSDFCGKSSCFVETTLPGASKKLARPYEAQAWLYASLAANFHHSAVLEAL